MLNPDDAETDSRRHSGDLPKTRRCLRCGSPFQSEWSGERICKPCKGTANWRNGLPYSGDTGRRR